MLYYMFPFILPSHPFLLIRCLCVCVSGGWGGGRGWQGASQGQGIDGLRTVPPRPQAFLEEACLVARWGRPPASSGAHGVGGHPVSLGVGAGLCHSEKRGVDVVRICICPYPRECLLM